MPGQNPKIQFTYGAKINRLIAANEKVSRSIRAVQNNMRKMETAGNEAGRSFNFIRGLSSQFLGVSGAVGATTVALYGIKRAVQSIYSTVLPFREQMNRVKALTMATNTEFAKLSGQAKNLGATTQFTLTQIAGGQAYLAQAGLEVNEIYTATPAILDLSAAGLLDMSTAADIATNVMGGFSLTTRDLNRVVDVLAKTANTSNTNVTQLGNALSYVASPAEALGISIEQTSAALGVLANLGLADRSGRGLRSLFQSLAKVSGDAEAVFESFGVAVFDAQGKTRNFLDVLSEFYQAGATYEDFAKVFSTESITIALNLAKNVDEVRRLQEAYENAAGSAAQTRDIMQEGLVGATKELTSAWEALKNEIGENPLIDGTVNTTLGITTQALRAFSYFIDLIGESMDMLTGNNIRNLQDALEEPLTLVLPDDIKEATEDVGKLNDKVSELRKNAEEFTLPTIARVRPETPIIPRDSGKTIEDHINDAGLKIANSVDTYGEEIIKFEDLTKSFKRFLEENLIGYKPEQVLPTKTIQDHIQQSGLAAAQKEALNFYALDMAIPKFEKFNHLAKSVTYTFKDLGRTISNSFESAILHAETFGDAMKKLSQIAATSFVASLFEPGGLIRSGIFKRERGGPVAANQPYVVGEKGPEYFIPQNHGTIVPNNKIGGEVNVTTNVNVEGNMDENKIIVLSNQIAASVRDSIYRERFVARARSG